MTSAERKFGVNKNKEQYAEIAHGPGAEDTESEMVTVRVVNARSTPNLGDKLRLILEASSELV